MDAKSEFQFNWADHIQEVHRLNPGFTAQSFAPLKDALGLNSYARLARLVPEGDGSRILDLACGDGDLTSQILTRLGSRGQVVGLDLSLAEIERAKTRVQDSRASFIQARAEALPFPEQSFDLVLCHLALMLMNPVGPVVHEIGRMLKPGGSFAAVLPAPLDDDLLIALSRLCMEFIEEVRPGWQKSVIGDAGVGSEAGLAKVFTPELGFSSLQMETHHFQMHTDREGIWRFLEGNYFVHLLSVKEKSQLQARVDLFLETYKRNRFRIEMPFRFLKVNLSGPGRIITDS